MKKIIVFGCVGWLLAACSAKPAGISVEDYEKYKSLSAPKVLYQCGDHIGYGSGKEMTYEEVVTDARDFCLKRENNFKILDGQRHEVDGSSPVPRTDQNPPQVVYPSESGIDSDLSRTNPQSQSSQHSLHGAPQQLQQSSPAPIPFDMNNPLEGLPNLGPEDPRSIEHNRNPGSLGHGSQDEFIRGQERIGCDADCDGGKYSCYKGCRLGNLGSDCINNCDQAANICKSRCR